MCVTGVGTILRVFLYTLEFLQDELPAFPGASEGRLPTDKSLPISFTQTTSSKECRKRRAYPPLEGLLSGSQSDSTHPRSSAVSGTSSNPGPIFAFPLIFSPTACKNHSLEHSPAPPMLRAWRYLPASEEGLPHTGCKG